MSMFRRPGDSSSSSEASYDQTEDEDQLVSQQHGTMTRINTLDSDASEVPATADRPSLANMRGFSTQDMQALGFHSMLEQNAITAAAARLHVDSSHPDAVSQGREAYQRMARQLPNGIDGKYAGDDYRAMRTTMQDTINNTTSLHLQTIEAGPEGTHSLIRRHRNGAAVPATQSPLSNINTLSDLPTLAPWLPDLQNDRYARDFSEHGIVGKGGYGKVFKVKHKLDGHFYAVKRILVPSAKVERFQRHGPDELNGILKEVRHLATFDHANIVRYHNAWLELAIAPTGMPSVPATPVVPGNRLLEDAANFSSSPADVNYLQSRFDDIQFEESSAGIVFEASNVEDSQGSTHHVSLRDQLRVKRKNRRSSQASQATIATISSTRSHMSAVEDISEASDDNEVEVIQRRHMPSSQEASTEASESIMSHSDMPEQALISTRSNGQILTLNVQMTLYETNLAAFLSPEQTPCTSTPRLSHCFHPCVSLELLTTILSGVEYLHSHGVVHRDLKPANIFLALSTTPRAPYGSVDLSSCTPCPDRARLHVVPRIGDFGLVAALDSACTAAAPTAAKPVGTAFYRPEAGAGNSEKLDVFALGVVALEMLVRFETRMERGAALLRLKDGEFPEGFAERLGPAGDRIQMLVGAMVMRDEMARMGCEEARGEIAALVEGLKGGGESAETGL